MKNYDFLHELEVVTFRSEKCVEEFIRSVEATSQYLNINPSFRGKITDSKALRDEFEEIREELFSELGLEPGEEHLAILIQSTYPRKA